MMVFGGRPAILGKLPNLQEFIRELKANDKADIKSKSVHARSGFRVWGSGFRVVDFTF